MQCSSIVGRLCIPTPVFLVSGLLINKEKRKFSCFKEVVSFWVSVRFHWLCKWRHPILLIFPSPHTPNMTVPCVYTFSLWPLPLLVHLFIPQILTPARCRGCAQFRAIRRSRGEHRCCPQGAYIFILISYYFWFELYVSVPLIQWKILIPHLYVQNHSHSSEIQCV